jgi:hypothetical protein
MRDDWAMKLNASDAADLAGQKLASGNHKAALRFAWEAATLGVVQHDEGPVRTALQLANELAVSGDARTRKKAGGLVTYCQALLDGVGDGVQAPSMVMRLLRKARRG